MDQEQTVKHSDFSIEHILNRAGSRFSNNNETGAVTEVCDRNAENDVDRFQWLQCSRYCPPKIPRIHRKEVQKRQLGRHPRIPFTSYQLVKLEEKFRESPYISSEEVTALSKKLQLVDIRIKIWFQNRRARERRERNGPFGDNKTKDSKSPQGDTTDLAVYNRLFSNTKIPQDFHNKNGLVNNVRSELNPDLSTNSMSYLST